MILHLTLAGSLQPLSSTVYIMKRAECSFDVVVIPRLLRAIWEHTQRKIETPPRPVPKHRRRLIAYSSLISGTMPLTSASTMSQLGGLTAASSSMTRIHVSHLYCHHDPFYVS